MKRRLTIYSLGIVLSAIGRNLRAIAPSHAADKKRNIVHVVADGLGGKDLAFKDDDPVWRMRRQNSQLSTIMPGWNYRAPLSPAKGNPRWHLEVPGGAAAMIYFQGKAIHKEFMRRHGVST